MKEQIIIREIEVTDAARIAGLNQELGYQVSSSLVERQLETILTRKDQYGYVAIIEGEIAGYIHAFISIRLTSDPFLEIGGLIVAEQHRRAGVGRMLVEHLEEQVNGFGKMRVRCNVKRNAAHKFYSSLNFIENKEQKVFDKKLPGTNSELP